MTQADANPLQEQLQAAQRDNTRLIARIVELDEKCMAHAAIQERANRLAFAIRHALAMGLPGHATTYLRAALGDELAEPPRAVDPPATCWNCGLPLAGNHLHDEVVITRGSQVAHVHRACAEHLTRAEGWRQEPA